MSLTSIGGGLYAPPPETRAALVQSVSRLSSGLRIAGPGDDPGGLAAATGLQTRSQGLDQGRRNVGDAADAMAVAQGALATVSSALQQMRTLTVQARSDLLSPADRAAINAQMRILSREIDSVGQSAAFNGLHLFTSGAAPRTRAAAVVQDDPLASGKPLVDKASLYVDPSNGANLDFRVSIAAYDPVSKKVTVQFDASSPSPAQTFDNTFPQSRALPTAQPSSTWWIDDATHANRLITLTINQVSAADVGKSFEVKTSVPAAPAGSLAVATGGREGQTVSVSTNAVSAAALGLSGARVGSSDAANQALQTAIDGALATIGGMRAALGAQAVSLGEESSNAAVASANLAASRSAIADLNVAAEATNYARLGALQSVQGRLAASTRREAFAEIGSLFNRLA